METSDAEAGSFVNVLHADFSVYEGNEHRVNDFPLLSAAA